jgi:hypothetical protein
MFKSSFYSLKEKEVDLVIATSTPLTVGFPALILKKIKGVPFGLFLLKSIEFNLKMRQSLLFVVCLFFLCINNKSVLFAKKKILMYIIN